MLALQNLRKLMLTATRMETAPTTVCTIRVMTKGLRFRPQQLLNADGRTCATRRYIRPSVLAMAQTRIFLSYYISGNFLYAVTECVLSGCCGVKCLAACRGMNLLRGWFEGGTIDQRYSLAFIVQ